MALSVEGGRIEEQKVKINIAPMFRSKWILSPSAWQVGGHPVPQDLMYRVIKGPSQRRDELPFPQDQMMGRRGPSVPRVPSGGQFMFNSQPFVNTDTRSFGKTGNYLGKKPRFPMNADGGLHGRLPFYAFNPHAQFHPRPAENANNQQNLPPWARSTSSDFTEHIVSENAVQSRPVAEEALGEVQGAGLSTVSLQSGTIGQENINPRVSLPEKPAVVTYAVPEQCKPQAGPDQAANTLHLPARPDKSPVRQTKKKRQAVQLRAANNEVKEPTGTASGPLEPAAIAASNAQPVANQKEVRRPALFTADEIKDRQQAWVRIAVPLGSPRKPSLSGDAQLAKPGHDRAKSLPIATLLQSPKVGTAEDKKACETNKGEPSGETVEREIKVSSDAGPSVSGGAGPECSVPSSPKKMKIHRKKKNKADTQPKPPAKKEHKL